MLKCSVAAELAGRQNILEKRSSYLIQLKSSIGTLF
jgi:hypothetical protein